MFDVTPCASFSVHKQAAFSSDEGVKPTHLAKEAAMTVTDYLLHVFYLIDSQIKALNLPPLRRRGPQPRLSDSEVITIELAGEFLGLDTDQGIYRFFRRYHRGSSPPWRTWIARPLRGRPRRCGA